MEKDGIPIRVASRMDLCHLKHAELCDTPPNGSVRRTWQRRLLDTMSRLPCMARETRDAVKSEAPRMLGSLEKECPQVWIRLPPCRGQNIWDTIEEPVVLLERNLYSHPVGKIAVGNKMGRSFLDTQIGRGTNVGTSSRPSHISIIRVRKCGRHEGWLGSETVGNEHFLAKDMELEDPTPLLSRVCLGCSEREEVDHDAVESQADLFRRITVTDVTNEKQTKNNLLSIEHGVELRHGMEGHAEQCVERYCELACRSTSALKLAETPCMDARQFIPEFLNITRELAPVSAHIVLKCSYLARIGRPDLLWTVNMLARSVTQWNKARDESLARLIC